MRICKKIALMIIVFIMLTSLNVYAETGDILFDVSAKEINAGDTVKHPMFGNGLILSATKMGADILYEVAFDTVGTKKLMGTFAKLTKI